jgi:hypothetical protein
MRFKQARFVKSVFLLLLASFLALNTEMLVRPSSAQSAGSSGAFSYGFIVDEDGFTLANITYSSNQTSGSSWLLVPNSQDWANRTVKGKVTELSLSGTENYLEGSYYFYEVLHFSFVSSGSGFEMNIQFNVSTAAIIIEPNGIFYSPQIGFESGNNLKAEVMLPHGFSVNSGEALAYGRSGNYQSSSGSNSNYVLFSGFPTTENLMRIEVGFKTAKKTPDLSTVSRGLFSFETVQRYRNYAYEILDLYNRTYGDLVRLFNVTIESAKARFFIPDFNSLLSIGGYVPISGEGVREIHINIVFTRYVTGYIEVIALHELVHYFMWEAGVSPQNLLWFHEGMAQYVSTEVANNYGYEGAAMTKQELEDSVTQLQQVVGNDLGFLEEWTPDNQPRDTGILYTAAYYVASRLAEGRGGLEYYARFFKAMNGQEVDNNLKLAYYLSLAANSSVVTALNNWGFAITDFYGLAYYAEKVISKVNPIFQPYKSLAEFLYDQALSNAARGTLVTTLFLLAAVWVAISAPLLTLITVSGVLFGVIFLVLRRKGVFRD